MSSRRWLLMIAFALALAARLAFALGHWVGRPLTSYLGILPLALAGWWKLRQQVVPAAPLWLLGASVVFTCLVFSPQERFRTPVLDLVMIVGASAALAGRGDRRPA